MAGRDGALIFHFDIIPSGQLAHDGGQIGIAEGKRSLFPGQRLFYVRMGDHFDTPALALGLLTRGEYPNDRTLASSHLAFDQRRFYPRLISVGIDIESRADVFDQLVTGLYPEGLAAVMRHFKIGFSRNFYYTFCAGKSSRISNRGGCVEPDPASIRKGEVILAASRAGSGVIRTGAW